MSASSERKALFSVLAGIVVTVLTVVSHSTPVSANQLSVSASDGQGASGVMASTPSTVGRNFSLIMPPNINSEVMKLHISSSQSGSGTYTVAGSTTNFTLTANQAVSLTLPSDAYLLASSDGSVRTISNKIITVQTSVPASVYADSQGTASSDASSVIPDEFLGTRYRVLAPKHDTSFGRLSILAVENGTSVTFTPRTTVNGLTAGVAEVRNLNAGDTWTIPTASGQDLSGSVVESSRPVGVFASADCANGSTSFPYVSRNQIGACDTLFEQIPPVSSWGRSFVFNAFADRKQGGTPVRIVADQDNTVVNFTLDGTPLTSQNVTLSAGQVWQYNFWESATAQSSAVNTGLEIESTKPVLVGVFMRGGGNYDGQTGDPAFAFIPPFEQFLTSYTVVSASPNQAQLLNVAVRTSAVASFRLDGQAVAAGQFENTFAPVGTSGWSVAQIRTTAGSHTVSSDLAFGLMVYGANSFNSYAYVGGMSLSPVGLVESVTLVTSSSVSGVVGQQVCLQVSVLDANGAPLPGIRVDGSISGVGSGTPLVGTTSSSGAANLCYSVSAAGTDTVTLTSNQRSTNVTVTWSVVAPDFSYSPASISLSVGDSMPSLSAVSTSSPVTSWSVSPVLPAGLSISSDGTIAGTPTAVSGATSYVVSGTNSAGSSNFAIQIEVTSAPVPPSISYSPSVFNLSLDRAMTAAVPQSSGSFPTWGISPGLPAGLVLNVQTGIISGTPSVVSPQASYTVTATNAAASVTTSVTISVGEIAPDISYPQSSVVYVVNTPVAQLLPTNVGSPANSWTVSPDLPVGLAFNSFTGQISGTPTATSSATVHTVSASNSAGTDSFPITIQVAATLSPPDISYASTTVGLISLQVMSPLVPINTGGPASSFSIAPSLPLGMSFNSSTGVLSGVPQTSLVATSYLVTATNAAGSDTVTLTLTVSVGASSPDISYATPMSLTVSIAMTPVDPTNSGGAATSFSIAPSLPLGLSIDPTTGRISGTPSVASNESSYVVTATNSFGSDTFTIRIQVGESESQGAVIHLWRVFLHWNGGVCVPDRSYLHRTYMEPIDADTSLLYFLGYGYVFGAVDCHRDGFELVGWDVVEGSTEPDELPLLVDPDGQLRWFIARDAELRARWSPID